MCTNLKLSSIAYVFNFELFVLKFGIKGTDTICLTFFLCWISFVQVMINEVLN